MPLRRAAIWMMLMIIFGLFQMWIDLLYVAIVKPKEMSLFYFIKDGGILFFLLAVTSGITIDYQLAECSHSPNLFQKISFIFFPFIIFGCVVCLYMIIKLINIGAFQYRFNYANTCLFFLTIVYGFFSKLFLFSRESVS